MNLDKKEGNSALDRTDSNSIIRADTIIIEPSCPYQMVITWESNNKSKITPTITIPKKKGWIKSNQCDSTFMLSTCNSVEAPICEIEIFSESGCVDISYHCQLTDYRGVSFWASSKILQWSSIKKESLTATKNRYYCTDEFGNPYSYIFTLEWKRLG